MRYIEDFTEGENIIGHYLCKQKQNMKSKAGKSYLSLVLQDKTGTIDGKVWELNNSIQAFEENDYIKLDAMVISYQNDLQLRITRIRKSMPGEYEPADYIPSTTKDVESLFNQLMSFVTGMENPYLKGLLENVLGDSEISRAFKTRSAAKRLHHSFMGGLIEHTLNVVSLCDFMSTRYKHVNRELLLTSAILHDLAKIYELSDFPENDYTDEGQLLGHIVMGAELIEREAGKIQGFPSETKNLLKHSILAHHGEYEFGSPKRPKTIEAFILYCADNMDAKVRMFEEALDADKTQAAWIGYNKILARNVRKSDVGQE